MKIYDVSMPITKEMQVYKNKVEKKPTIEVASDFETGTTYESKITFNLHTGTHMDFSKHVYPDGLTSKTLDLGRLITDVKVFDLTSVEDGITKRDIEHLDITENDFVLFKTKNSFEDEFNYKFIYIKSDAAAYLAAKKIKGIGVDALGIERDQKGYPTHKAFFDNDIILIEGLRLEKVLENKYLMIALPLKIEDVEALPLSIVLIES